MSAKGDGKSKLQDLIIELLNKGRDEVDNANISIELEHHEVHEEKSFHIDAVVAADTSVSISFKTNSITEIHLVISYASQSASHIEYKEGVVITATTGTEKAVINRDRNSTNECSLLQNKSGVFVADNKVLIGATTTGGTSITEHPNWVDKKYGTNRRGEGEFILKHDTEYEFILTSDDGDKGLHIDLNWYEVDV